MSVYLRIMKNEVATPSVGVKRFFRKIIINFSTSVWIPSTKRWYFLRMAGVQIEGPCFLGPHVSIDTLRPDLIKIGAGSVITQGTVILTHFIKDDCMYYGKVNIGRRVFVGINTIIANSVTIGDGALIGAGSIVTKDIPSAEVWAGNPARYIKKRMIDL